VKHGPRSNKKAKVLHGWVLQELRRVLDTEYNISGLSRESSSEESVTGIYYSKNVDVAITRNGIDIGVVSIKFINSNFKQNANNYFEQQMGETANLRKNDIVFGHLLCVTEPIPYNDRAGNLTKSESIRNIDVLKYLMLSRDHLHFHAPDVQALCVVSLDLENKEIKGLCTREQLPNLSNDSHLALEAQLNIERFFSVFTRAIELKYQKRYSELTE